MLLIRDPSLWSGVRCNKCFIFNTTHKVCPTCYNQFCTLFSGCSEYQVNALVYDRCDNLFSATFITLSFDLMASMCLDAVYQVFLQHAYATTTTTTIDWVCHLVFIKRVSTFSSYFIICISFSVCTRKINSGVLFYIRSHHFCLWCINGLSQAARTSVRHASCIVSSIFATTHFHVFELLQSFSYSLLSRLVLFHYSSSLFHNYTYLFARYHHFCLCYVCAQEWAN